MLTVKTKFVQFKRHQAQKGKHSSTLGHWERQTVQWCTKPNLWVLIIALKLYMLNTSAFPQWPIKRYQAGKSWAVHLGMEDSCLRRTAMKVKRGSNMDAQTYDHFSSSHSAMANDSWQEHISQRTKYCILHDTTAGKNATSAPTKTFKCADKTANTTQHRNIYSRARISVLRTSNIHWKQPKQVFADLQSAHSSADWPWIRSKLDRWIAIQRQR